MKRGSGWVRRITKENLAGFAPLLAAAGSQGPDLEEANPADLERRQRSKKQTARQQEEFRQAARLFTGRSIRSFSTTPIGTTDAHKPSTGTRARRGRAGSTPGAGIRAPTATGKGNLAWEKHVLSATDAQQQEGNRTGDIRLTQAGWRVEGEKVDSSSFFRDVVFGALSWQPTAARKRPLKEGEAPHSWWSRARFQITIDGKDYGIHELDVSHKPSGVAGQGNYTTGIHWGEFAETIRKLNVTGKRLRLFTPSAGAGNPYTIEIGEG